LKSSDEAEVTSNHSKKKWPWVNIINPDCYLTRAEWPKISIVTPSYNQAQYIEETILSIINQNYPNLEFIIIDGGSKDETSAIIKKYESYIKYWLSEPDNGQVEAILKGFKHCTGEIFNWINSDDLLAENALFNIAEAYLNDSSLKVITGGCTHFTNDRTSCESTFVKDLTFDGLISEQSYFQQPSQWIVLKAIKDLNIESNLHYSFDWGMILNLDLKSEEIKYLSVNISFFREHEEAKTFKDGLLFKYEKLVIVREYFKKTKNLSRRAILFHYIFKLSRYLKIVAEIEKRGKNNLITFLIFGLQSPSLFLMRFYLGHLKSLLLEKNN
jgi:glycosyltransferase involved in cell wall biosynthesis